MTRAGSPHSDTLGSQPASRLPEAYRRPPRPSSAPDAKASTERPKKQNTNPTKTSKPQTTPPQPQPQHKKNRGRRRRGAARATQRTKILASTIQITTNPPTHARPTPRTKKGPARRTGPQPGRTAPEPDSMRPPPHTRCRDRHPNPPTPIKKNRGGIGACFPRHHKEP